MKVTLEVYGFGGALGPLVFDSTRLPPQEASDLASLVAAAKAEKTKPEVRTGDTIRIEDADGNVELKQLPSDMTAGFKALRSWLNEHSRQGTRNTTR
jgi:hypothetical protein